MRVDTRIAAVTLLGITAMAGTASAQNAPADGDTTAIVKALMNDAYGDGFDAKNQCWAYTWKDTQGESIDYCMRPGTPHVIEAGGSKSLYLNTYNATDIRSDPRYGYTQVQPGLMGAFKIRIAANQAWTYEAIDNAMDYGSAGECGCAHAQFVKLSNAGAYGWLFTSGGTWQGITVADYSIVTPVKARMKDVSKIPQVTEKAPGVTYAVAVAPAPSAKGMFPLHVTRSKAGEKAATFDVAFDPAKSVYALPAGQ